MGVAKAKDFVRLVASHGRRFTRYEALGEVLSFLYELARCRLRFIVSTSSSRIDNWSV
jgi:hypothetical protein